VVESTSNELYYITFCVRDGKNSIKQVMDSYIHQTSPPSKIIAVDDGSTDGTYEILQSYAKSFPNLVELLETHSTTRDYSRIPKLWNMGLRKGYTYHMIGAGDAALSPNYAELILKEMTSNPHLVICSGDYGLKKSKSPHGGGRFVRQSFFFENYTGYPWIIGYESEILERALLKGHEIKVLKDAEIYHLDKLGHSHNFREFGYGMRALGYFPLYSLGRIVLVFFRDKNVGKIGALNMLKYYICFRPSKTGYYSQFPKEIRDSIRTRQKKSVMKFLKRIMKQYIMKQQEEGTNTKSLFTAGFIQPILSDTSTVIPNETVSKKDLQIE